MKKIFPTPRWYKHSTKFSLKWFVSFPKSLRYGLFSISPDLVWAGDMCTGVSGISASDLISPVDAGQIPRASFLSFSGSQEPLSYLVDLFKRKEYSCLCLIGSSENFQSKETPINGLIDFWQFGNGTSVAQVHFMWADFLFFCSLLYPQYLHNALHLEGTQHSTC